MKFLVSKALLSLLSILTLLPINSSFQYTEEWIAWKKEYGKQYSSPEEELKRQRTFESNMKRVVEHNSGSGREWFTMEMNEFGDLSAAEFHNMYHGYRGARFREENTQTTTFVANITDVPDSWDWRDKNIITPIKNQGQCGSCWSFSATGCLEGQHALKTGKLVSLSEQQLMDCSDSFGNAGCNGGLMTSAFQYIAKAGGDDTEESYPYQAKNGTCRFNPKSIGASDTGYVHLPRGDEVALLQAVYKIGPIAVAMDAYNLQLYKKGIFYDAFCSFTNFNHGVLAVGYGATKDGKDFWVVKNSWGAQWGMDGYFKMARYVGNMCGIATDASYPIGVS